MQGRAFHGTWLKYIPNLYFLSVKLHMIEIVLGDH